MYGTPPSTPRCRHDLSQGDPMSDTVTACSQYLTLRGLIAPAAVGEQLRQITDANVAEPGLTVVEVAAADDETALTVQQLLAARCAIAPADRTTREPGEPGVRLRCFLGPAPGARLIALRSATTPR